jgi:protoporphyrin/coproporphyrin ferrochelatase
MSAPIGVLIMAYGGPGSLDDLPGYLSDIRSGRVTTPAVLEEITDHYRRIGGRSPLLEITRRQADVIAERLDPERFRCYVGMRHWAPWIDEVVGRMAEEGIRRAVSLVMAPHFSSMSIARYRAKIEEGLRLYHAAIEFKHIDEYHDAPGLIEALARRVLMGIEGWPEGERSDVHVIFSAHSLPVRILRDGDPYDAQLRRTASLVAARAGLSDERWSWSFQSAGKSPEPWLGPQLEEHIPELAKRGIRKAVSIPVGFVADHVEILYDIDIEAMSVAEKCGMKLVRPPALNDDPLFMETLADLVRKQAAPWLEEE